MDLTSESAAIYVLVGLYLLRERLFYIFLFQVIGTLYLVMVVVMVGMNYKMKERSKDGDGKEEKVKSVTKSSSVSFTEGRGTFSTLVYASTKTIKRKVDV